METFSKFVAALPPSGHLIVCADDQNCLRLAEQSPCPVTTYGIHAGDLRAEITGSDAYTRFEDGQ